MQRTTFVLTIVSCCAAVCYASTKVNPCDNVQHDEIEKNENELQKYWYEPVSGVKINLSNQELSIKFCPEQSEDLGKP